MNAPTTPVNQRIPAPLREPLAPLRQNVILRPVQPQPQQAGIENGPADNVFGDAATQFFMRMINEMEQPDTTPSTPGEPTNLPGLPDDGF